MINNVKRTELIENHSTFNQNKEADFTSRFILYCRIIIYANVSKYLYFFINNYCRILSIHMINIISKKLIQNTL